MSIGWVQVADQHEAVPTGFWLRVRDLDGHEREACCRRLADGSYIWSDRDGHVIDEPAHWLWCGW